MVKPIVGTSGGNKDVIRMFVGTSSGNKEVLEGWIGTSAGNKQFFTSLKVELDTYYLELHGDGFHLPVSGGPVTCMVTGGIGPFVFAWTRISGNGNVVSPAAAATDFALGVSPPGADNGDFVCTVTDSGSGLPPVVTSPLTVVFYNP